MKKIIILMIMVLISLSLVSALSINNTIPTEINSYNLNLSQYLNIVNADAGNISFNNTQFFNLFPESTIDNLVYSGENFSVSSQDTAVFDIDFNNDGTKMFIMGVATDTIYQYDLSTGYDITTAIYSGDSFSVSGQDSQIWSIEFSLDGLTFFAVGSGNDRVYEYDLSTAYDITTASYSSNSFSVSGQDSTPYDINFNNDGSKFYVLGIENNRVYEYDLSTAYDITTASYSSNSFSVSAQDSQPGGFSFNTNGEKMFMVGSTTDSIYSYDLSTAYDITTASYSSNSFSVSAQDSSFFGLALNNDNSKFYALGGSDFVFSYDLPSGFDAPEISFNNNGDISYTITASNSTNSINETGSILINPAISFNFQFNSTNIENYSFGDREDTSGFVTYNIYNDGLELGNNTLTFYKFGYILQDFIFTLTNTTNTNFTFNVTPAQINVNIYDRITQNLITQNVDLQLIGDVGDTISTSTGTAQLNAIDGVPGNYQIIATSIEYETESVYFEYTNQENLSLDIYLINSTDLSLGFVTIEVKDTLSFFIEGSIVNLLEWRPAISSFITVAQCQTLSNGKCNLNIELSNKLYKFQATKDETSAETTSIIIDETAQTIPITLQDILLIAVPNSNNILSNMTQNINTLTNTSLIRLQWSTKDNTNAKACISVFSNPGYSQSLIGQNCTVSNSGVLFINVDINQPQTIKVDGTIQDAFNVYLIDSFVYEGTGTLSKALNDYNIDILIPIIFLFIGLSVGLLFGNIYISLILGIILQWVATIIAGNVISVSVAVVITFITSLIIWGVYKK